MSNLSADRIRKLDSLVHNWLQDADIPGASVVVFDTDGELYAEGFGARNLESNAPATPETLYGVGSITKPITALAIVDLAERGAVSLSDPIDRYVDHYIDAPGEPITIAELLSHTSGMPATSAGLLSQAVEGYPAGVADEADRERLVREATELRVTDRERFFYYNTGYDVLGRVIESVDGRTYAEYIQEELLAPLGMHRATFHRESFESDDDAMTGYKAGEDAPTATEFPFEELIHPSGGLVCSVRDLSKFVRATMTDGSLDGNRVAEPAVVERAQQGRAVRQTRIDGTVERYGYGWMRRGLLDDELVGHGGSIIVSTAYAGFLENAQVGVAVACNTSADPHPMELAGAILAVASGEPATAEPTFALEEKCEAVTGSYESFDDQLTATVERDRGGIAVTISGSWGEEEFTAYPETLTPDDHTFYTVAGNGGRELVEFDVTSDYTDLFYARSRLQRA